MKTGMNKGRILRMAAAAGMAFCIWGCGNAAETGAVTETQNAQHDEAAAEETAEAEAEKSAQEPAGESKEGNAGGYCFMAGDVKIQADMDMDELAAKLGESNSVYETPSCAGDGTAYIYDYVSYEIETYPAGDGKNRIAYIVLKDDTVATPEGADLSMTKKDIVGIYGEDYEEAGEKISYESADTKLNFVFDGDNVISIEYASGVIG